MWGRWCCCCRFVVDFRLVNRYAVVVREPIVRRCSAKPQVLWTVGIGY